MAGAREDGGERGQGAKEAGTQGLRAGALFPGEVDILENVIAAKFGAYAAEGIEVERLKVLRENACFIDDVDRLAVFLGPGHREQQFGKLVVREYLCYRLKVKREASFALDIEAVAVSSETKDYFSARYRAIRFRIIIGKMIDKLFSRQIGLPGGILQPVGSLGVRLAARQGKYGDERRRK